MLLLRVLAGGSVWMVVAGGLGSVACGKEAPPAADTTPIVGALELPISLRTGDRVREAAHVEISPSELRLDGARVIGLERGRVAAGELEAGSIRALRGALGAASARRTLALRMHVSTPYTTLFAIMTTARAVGMREVAFEVRAPGGHANTGWMLIPEYRLEAATDQSIVFEGAPQRTWDEFMASWNEAADGCRRSNMVSCPGAPEAPTPGGMAEIVVATRGNAVSIEVHRFGAPDAAAAPSAPFLAGVSRPAQVEAPTEPVTDATFMWRDTAATTELSPLTFVMRPLCGNRPCGVVVHAQPTGMAGKVVSALGAAFPDGGPAPLPAFVGNAT